MKKQDVMDLIGEVLDSYETKEHTVKTQAIINGWSVLNTGDGIACKYVQGDNVFEVCLSIIKDTEVYIEVHQEGVDEPVAKMSLEGERR
jgi:hypothetical protein